MSYKLVHTNYLGQVHSEHGNPCRKDSTAQVEFDFPTLEEALQHANAYIQRYPELQCEIRSEDPPFEQRVVDREAQQQFINQFCRVGWKDRLMDISVISLVVLSVIANIVLLYLLLR